MRILLYVLAASAGISTVVGVTEGRGEDLLKRSDGSEYIGVAREKEEFRTCNGIIVTLESTDSVGKTKKTRADPKARQPKIFDHPKKGGEKK
jgi:hypothetical protein